MPSSRAAVSPSMPRSALDNVEVDFCLPLAQIADVLVQLASGRATNVTESANGGTDMDQTANGEQAISEPPGEQVPIDLDEGMGMYRTLLANRRVLIVLDNAGGVDQVRPLLPGSAGCLVLVTSRGRLGSLTSTPGAHSPLVRVAMVRRIRGSATSPGTQSPSRIG